LLLRIGQRVLGNLSDYGDDDSVAILLYPDDFSFEIVHEHSPSFITVCKIMQ
jgi:hypothetical protein